MTSWARRDGGSGVRADRPTPREGRSREGSGKPGQSHTEQEKAAAPAALGELSQTSAPASGLRRAQGAARKLEPGPPERSGASSTASLPGDAAGSPQPHRCGPRALQCPAAPSQWHRTVPGGYSELDTSADPQATWRWHRLLARLHATAMNAARAVPGSQGCRCCHRCGGIQHQLPSHPQQTTRPKRTPPNHSGPGVTRGLPWGTESPTGCAQPRGSAPERCLCTRGPVAHTHHQCSLNTAAGRCLLSSQPPSLPPRSPGSAQGDSRIGPGSTRTLPQGQDETSLGVPMGFYHRRVVKFKQLQGWSQLAPVYPWGSHPGSCPSQRAWLS